MNVDIGDAVDAVMDVAARASALSIWLDEGTPAVVVLISDGELDFKISHPASSLSHARLLFRIADEQPIEAPKTYLEILQIWLGALLGASEVLEPVITCTRSTERSTH